VSYVGLTYICVDAASAKIKMWRYVIHVIM